jgi:hypothetical protein
MEDMEPITIINDTFSLRLEMLIKLAGAIDATHDIVAKQQLAKAMLITVDTITPPDKPKAAVLQVVKNDA